MSAEQREVEITVKVIGPGRPATARVPSPIKVSDLRKLIAAERALPVDRLKFVLRGKTLHDSTNSIGGHGQAIIRLEDGDSLVVAVMPKPPAEHLCEDDDDDNDLKFQIPQSASLWRRKIFYFLHDKLRLPDILLMAIFSISLKAWVGIVLWFSIAPVAHRLDIGPLYILVTGFLIIIFNLGKRQQGDLSAYSIFNEDFRELPGTLNADRLDNDIRAGQF